MTEPVGHNPRDIDIPNNSHAAQQSRASQAAKKTAATPADAQKEERPVVTKIIEGKVVVTKTPWYKRAMRSMIADDATSVGDYLITDVIVPSAKRLIADIVQSSTERVLFGATSRRGRGSLRDGPSLRTRYDRMSEEPAVRGLSRDQVARHDFGAVTLPDRQEAFDVIEYLHEYAVKYGSVSVAELYTLVGTTGSYADRNWGWTDLTAGDVQQTRGGWRLVLPAPQPLR